LTRARDHALGGGEGRRIDRGGRHTGRAREDHDLVAGVARGRAAPPVEGGDIEGGEHRLVAGVHFSAGCRGAGCRGAGCLRGCPRPRSGRCRQGLISLECDGVALGVDGDGLARTGIATGGPYRTGRGATKYCPRRDRAQIELDGLTGKRIAQGRQGGAKERPPIARIRGRDHKIGRKSHFCSDKRRSLVRGHRDLRLAGVTGWNNDAGRVSVEYASQDGEERDHEGKEDRTDAHQCWSTGEVSASASFEAVFGVTTGAAS
jgi:hypothetical protein